MPVLYWYLYAIDLKSFTSLRRLLSHLSSDICKYPQISCKYPFIYGVF
ncbi:hypothetical protein HMPREF9445_02943 [Bacteroides clarus YIT 12056]|uniref:Toxin-antitoxin system, toxin component domain protein n=1 Tax=Bacteroides clarus YIT 12056 TaxID=762984 RepID=A0ABN0CJU6_9BACE|nr:hypothetical protein HMPREF9445_02943 [Bacteroides clarus YIT 12056]